MNQPYRTHHADDPRHSESLSGQPPRRSPNEPKSAWAKLPVGLWVGLAAALVGFVFRFSFSSTATTNGVITQCTYYDVGAVLAAIVCFIGAVAGLIAWLRHPAENRLSPALVLPIAAVIALIGVVHVLRGLGMIGGPC